MIRLMRLKWDWNSKTGTVLIYRHYSLPMVFLLFLELWQIALISNNLKIWKI